jgi:folate-dependent phosphoribosylglycinamide formyltransferase PurN
MKVTVFTSNQPRHLALVESIAGVADEVFAVHECLTVHPGKVADFYRNSPVMQEYFGRVIAAEREVFGQVRFLPANVRQLCLRMADLNMVEPDVLAPALDADIIVVFGASYIKGWLVDRLVARNAINIHMGISPYYRGSSCNFWAMFDGNPTYVGATIHKLSRGLDSGAMLFHAVPERRATDPFVFGMRAVRAAHQGLVCRIADGSLMGLTPVAQDKAQEIRYTRNADFTDEVARQYLDNLPTLAQIQQALDGEGPQLLAPVFA